MIGYKLWEWFYVVVKLELLNVSCVRFGLQTLFTSQHNRVEFWIFCAVFFSLQLISASVHAVEFSISPKLTKICELCGSAFQLSNNVLSLAVITAKRSVPVTLRCLRKWRHGVYFRSTAHAFTHRLTTDSHVMITSQSSLLQIVFSQLKPSRLLPRQLLVNDVTIVSDAIGALIACVSSRFSHGLAQQQIYPRVITWPQWAKNIQS